MDKKPDLLDHFEYNGRVEVGWFDVVRKEDLPDVPWRQVYAVGNLSGMVPVVIYDNGTLSLPGGTFESGETIDQALGRELQEELNCGVTNWQPLGYQKVWRAGDEANATYQLRVYAELEKIDEFITDPGGSVVGYRTVALSDLNTYINNGKVGDRLIEIAGKYF